jgi:K+-sensing histidine kinase KdpD
MPLISRNRRIGLIIADNCITHKTITPHDMQLMDTFAFPVAFALERASLYERLQEEVDKLTLANIKLQEQQELIVKMEKMAVVGQITSSIAHSIRNPLMIIGGFARSLVKTIPENDRNRDHLESIVREAKQLEDVLDEVLGYADSLYPATDTWDINQIVTGVFGKMKERLDLEKISFSLALASSLPLAVIDYKQIVFCVRTILNALIELPDVNAISVATRQIDDRVELEIRGNGSASLPESRSAAAESDSTFAEMEDTLGLPLCKAILEKNRAGLLIECEPGNWTRYIIRLHHLKGDD